METMTQQELIQLKKEVDAISQKLARYIEEQDEDVPEIFKVDLIKFIILSKSIPSTFNTRLANVVSVCVFGKRLNRVERDQTITIGEFIENYSMRDLLRCRNAGKKTALALQNAFKEVGVEWK